MKIKQSYIFALLTDEISGMSNISQLVSFFKYFVLKKKKADTEFITSFNLLSYLPNSPPNADTTVLPYKLKAFVSDRVSVMTGF